LSKLVLIIEIKTYKHTKYTFLTAALGLKSANVWGMGPYSITQSY